MPGNYCFRVVCVACAARRPVLHWRAARLYSMPKPAFPAGPYRVPVRMPAPSPLLSPYLLFVPLPPPPCPPPGDELRSALQAGGGGLSAYILMQRILPPQSR